MILEDQGNRLELVLLERIPDDLPTPGDVRLYVKVEAFGFAGAHDGVWVGKGALENFAAALRALERAREGEAVLESLSPGEFVLRVYSVDRAGHLALSGGLRRLTYGERVYEQTVRFGFDIDPETVRALIRALGSEFAA